jgi:hypothetical protein
MTAYASGILLSSPSLISTEHSKALPFLLNHFKIPFAFECLSLVPETNTEKNLSDSHGKKKKDPDEFGGPQLITGKLGRRLDYHMNIIKARKSLEDHGS